MSLNLSENESYKLAMYFVKRQYGRKKVRKQKPHRKIKYNEYWIFYGTLPERTKGGTFTIAINTINGAVAYLVHGK